MSINLLVWLDTIIFILNETAISFQNPFSFIFSGCIAYLFVLLVAHYLAHFAQNASLARKASVLYNRDLFDWLLSKERQIDSVDDKYADIGGVGNEDVITLNGMTIKILMLNEHELMIDMGSEIITAMKLPASAYPAPGVSISPEVLIGKWVLTHSVGSKKKDKETVSTWDKTNFSWESSLLLTINSNGTFEEEDKKGDNINWRPSGKGFWNISENKITISATGYYSISGENNIYHEFSTPEIREFIITRLTSTEIDFREYMFEDGFEYEETSTFTRVD